jgi:hypothetical protein
LKSLILILSTARIDHCVGSHTGWCDTGSIQWGVYSDERTACYKQTLMKYR